MPPENTLPSIEQAFGAGADFVEIDVVQTLDNQLIVIHSVNPEEHFFGFDKPHQKLNTLPWSSFKNIPVGRYQRGTIPTLQQLLVFISGRQPIGGDYCINIEIKGTEGSDQPRDSKSFLRNIARTVLESQVKPENTLFSSSCLQNIVDLTNFIPQAQYAMLFSEAVKSSGCYSDSNNQLNLSFLPFDIAHINYVSDYFRRHSQTGSQMSYVHPEIKTLNPETMTYVRQLGLSINTWVLFENFDDEQQDIYQKLIVIAERDGIDIGFITDYVPDLLDLFRNNLPLSR